MRLGRVKIKMKYVEIKMTEAQKKKMKPLFDAAKKYFKTGGLSCCIIAEARKDINPHFRFGLIDYDKTFRKVVKVIDGKFIEIE